MVVSATERKPGPRILWRSSPHWRSEWIARVQRPPPPPVEFTDQVFRFSARKGEFLEFFHRIARTELRLMELLFYKRFFEEYCRFACGRRNVLIILFVRSSLTFLFLGNRRRNESFFSIRFLFLVRSFKFFQWKKINGQTFTDNNVKKYKSLMYKFDFF